MCHIMMLCHASDHAHDHDSCYVCVSAHDSCYVYVWLQLTLFYARTHDLCYVCVWLIMFCGMTTPMTRVMCA